MRTGVLCLLLLNLGAWCWVLPAAAATAGDQVLFVRDEPLLLYGQPVATAKKGEIYTVLTTQPAARRVYVLARDHTGKTVSLNAPEFAVVVLPGRGEPAYGRALNALRLGRWVDAARELAAAAASEPDAAIYEQVKETLDGVFAAQHGVQQALAASEKAGGLSAAQRRNADRTPAENPLFPADKSGPARAAAYRKAAADIDTAAKTALDAAHTALESSGTLFDATLRSLAEARAYDAVLALLAARDRLLPGRSPDSLGDLIRHADLAAWSDQAASAAAATAATARDLAANRLDAADHEAAGGLLSLPADRELRALQMRVQMRLAAVRDRLPEIDTAENAGDLAGALRLVNALLAESIDDPVLVPRKTALEARLASSKPLSSCAPLRRTENQKHRLDVVAA